MKITTLSLLGLLLTANTFAQEKSQLPSHRKDRLAPGFPRVFPPRNPEISVVTSPAEEFLKEIDRVIRPEKTNTGIPDTERLAGVIEYVARKELDERIQFSETHSAEKLADASLLLDALIVERSRREKHKQNPDELDAAIEKLKSYRKALVNLAIDEIRYQGDEYRPTVLTGAQQVFFSAEKALRQELASPAFSSKDSDLSRIDFEVSEFRTKHLKVGHGTSHSPPTWIKNQNSFPGSRPVPMPSPDRPNTGKTPGIAKPGTGVIIGITPEGERVKIGPDAQK